MTTTTITIDIRVKKQLDRLKRHPRESYNGVLDRVLKGRRVGEVDEESLRETIEILSDPEIMKSLVQSLQDLKEGRVYSLEEV